MPLKGNVRSVEDYEARLELRKLIALEVESFFTFSFSELENSEIKGENRAIWLTRLFEALLFNACRHGHPEDGTKIRISAQRSQSRDFLAAVYVDSKTSDKNFAEGDGYKAIKRFANRAWVKLSEPEIKGAAFVVEVQIRI